MRYRPFLRGVHEQLQPPTYLEIGVRRGGSLALARSAAVGIDPDYDVDDVELGPDTTLFRETSDDYFARPDPLAPFDGRAVSLAFIDGMHLVEHALRDFINVERHAQWTSVAIIDDILPRNPREALRQRETHGWTGDIFKMLAILERHRPDLICLRVDVEPTGVLVVLGLDPANNVLEDRYAAILEETVTPDPQAIPDDVSAKRWAREPRAVLQSSIWSLIRDMRTRGVPREDGTAALRRVVRRDLGRVGPGRLHRFVRAARA